MNIAKTNMQTSAAIQSPRKRTIERLVKTIQRAETRNTLIAALGKLAYLTIIEPISVTELKCTLCQQVIKLPHPPTSKTQLYRTCALHVLNNHPTLVYAIKRGIDIGIIIGRMPY